MTFAIAEFFEMLQVEVSLLGIFNDNFSGEWVVRPPSKNVTAIPDEASASAISLCERSFTKINEINKVFSVPPGASKK